MFGDADWLRRTRTRVWERLTISRTTFSTYLVRLVLTKSSIKGPLRPKCWRLWLPWAVLYTSHSALYPSTRQGDGDPYASSKQSWPAISAISGLSSTKSDDSWSSVSLRAPANSSDEKLSFESRNLRNTYHVNSIIVSMPSRDTTHRGNNLTHIRHKYVLSSEHGSRKLLAKRDLSLTPCSMAVIR